MIEITTEPIQSRKTLGEQWDEWALEHGIPLPLLEMYRRHGDKPGYTCRSCRYYDNWICEQHGNGQILWDPDWVACGAHERGEDNDDDDEGDDDDED